MEQNKRFKGVIFDLGGTLRIAYLEEPYMRHSRRKMAEIAGSDLPYDEFYALIEARYAEYRKWANAEMKEAGDEELWGKWLLPDFDPVRVRQICHEMSYQYRQAKGRRSVVDGGVEVITELHKRGYKLGIISNMIGETEIADWLEEDGLDGYFDTVVLSSVCHLSKPCSEIYRLASSQMGLTPEDCASVGDNIKRDIPGAKIAGIGCNIIFDSPEKRHPVVFTEETRPDAVIADFREILNLLPPLDA